MEFPIFISDRQRLWLIACWVNFLELFQWIWTQRQNDRFFTANLIYFQILSGYFCTSGDFEAKRTQNTVVENTGKTPFITCLKL